MRRSVLALLALWLTPAPAFAEIAVEGVVSASRGYALMVARLHPSKPPRFRPKMPRGPAAHVPQLAFATEICAAAHRHGIHPAFLFAVVEVESAFDPMALSQKGARGLAQVMPTTAREVGIAPDRLWHPATNMEAAARYVRRLALRYDRDLIRVLAAYNAGPAVGDGQKPMPLETRAYVPRVTAAYRRYLVIERQGGELCAEP